jgi:SOS response regulatory protein OraA/RecX
VARPAIDQALAQAGDEDEAARAVLTKAAARYAGLESRARYRKLYALLARRGFSPPVISRALTAAERRAFDAADADDDAPEAPD